MFSIPGDPAERSPPETAPVLREALERGILWRGRDAAPARAGCVRTGFPVLDRVLPGGGWPLGTLIEVEPAPLPHVGVELFLPALAARMAAGRPAVWAAPPWRLHGPGLREWGLEPERMRVVETGPSDTETLWVMERFLRCASCAMVLGWVRKAAPAALRRLQFCAERGAGLGVLFHSPTPSPTRTSPAPVRLRVHPSGPGLQVTFLRLRGALGRRMVQVEPVP